MLANMNGSNDQLVNLKAKGINVFVNTLYINS